MSDQANGVQVGDLHLAITADPVSKIEQELRRVDTAAEAAAGGATSASVALQATADAGQLSARSLAEAWGVFGKTADGAEDLARGANAAETAVTDLGSSMSLLSNGGAIATGVVIGMTAIVAIYDWFTASARAAKEEQKKLTNALEEWNKAQSMGPGGKRQTEVNAEEKKLEDLRKQLKAAKADVQSAMTSGTYARAGTTDQMVSIARGRVQQIENEIRVVQQAITRGSKDVINTRMQATVDEIAAEIGDLRKLEKAGLLRVDQRKRLADLERNAAQLRDQYNAGPMDGISERQRLEMVVKLTDALERKATKEKKVKDTTDQHVAALVELGKQHQLTWGDLKEGERLYDAEAKIVDDSTQTIERRAKALERMKRLEEAGIVTPKDLRPDASKPDKLPDIPDPFRLPRGAGEELLKGIDLVMEAVRQHANNAISDLQLGAEIAKGIGQQIREAWNSQLQGDITALANSFASFTHDVFAVALDTIAAGFDGGWTSMKRVLLGGLGGILMAMGKQLLITGATLTGLLPALSNPFTSGPAMLAAGALIFGAGAALAAIAGRGASGGGGGGGLPMAGTIGSLGIGGTAFAPQTYVLGSGNRAPSSVAANGSTAQPRESNTFNFTVIGPNDQQAQRQIKEMVNAATRRGL